MSDPGPQAQAVVSCGTFRRSLVPGDTMTFGRGRDHDLRIGHAPEDLAIPRFAGKLECRDDGVLVHNLSARRTIVMQTFPGPEHDIAPMMITGTRPHPYVRLIVSGAASSYEITIDTRSLKISSVGQPWPMINDEKRTLDFGRIEPMPEKYRVMLKALCLPMLTKFGPEAEVPTYKSITDILNSHGYSYKVKTVINYLTELRNWLADVYRIPGLVQSGPQDAATNDTYLRRLAQWAVRSGNVTDDDLDSFGM